MARGGYTTAANLGFHTCEGCLPWALQTTTLFSYVCLSSWWIRRATHSREDDVKKDALLHALRETRELLARPDSDFARSAWGNAEAALREMDALIESVETFR